MTGRKDTSVNDRDEKISPLVISASESRDQRHRDDIDHTDGDHRAHRAECIDLRAFLDILGHRAAECSVWNINAGVSQHKDTVCNCHVNDLCGVRPVRMRPERHNEHKRCQGRRDQEPWAVPPPPRMRLVAQSSDDRIVDGVPEPGEEHQGRHRSHADAEHIGVEYHQKISHEHPAEIASHVAHAVCDLADQRHLHICISLSHSFPTLLPAPAASYPCSFSSSAQMRMTALTISALLFTL